MNALIPYQKTPPAELLSILEQYENETGCFSKKLLKWGAELLQGVIDYGKLEAPDDAKRLHIITEKTDALRRLIWDPFSNRPIHRLVFDGKRPWEREVYRDCQKVCQGVSPFDQEKMLEDPPAHTLSQKVLDWASLYLPPLVDFSQLSPSPMSVLEGPAFSGIKQFVYQKIAQGTVMEERLEKVQDELNEWLEKTKQLIQDIQRETDATIELVKSGVSDSRGELLRKIEWVEKVYQETTREFEKQKEWRDQTFENMLAQLKSAKESHRQAGQTAIQAANDRIRKLEIERDKEYAQYSQQFDQLKQSRDRAVASLRAQIDRNRQKWQSDEAAKQTEYRANVSAASARISQINQRAGQLRQEIDQVENRSQELSRLNSPYTDQISQLVRQINHLRADLNGLPSRSATRLFGVNF